MSETNLRLLIDTNVWIDYFLGFRSGNESARMLLRLAANAGADILYAALSSKDVFYLIDSDFKRHARQMSQGFLSPQDAATAQELAWGCLATMDEIATAVGCDQGDVWLARKHRDVHSDYEDDLVIAAAHRAQATLLVTNDERLLRHCPVAALDVADAIAYVRAHATGSDKDLALPNESAIPRSVAERYR